LSDKVRVWTTEVAEIPYSLIEEWVGRPDDGGSVWVADAREAVYANFNPDVHGADWYVESEMEVDL
jgi:hypothetical protein